MGIFDKSGLFEKLEHAVGFSEEARAQRKIEQLQEMIAESPNDVELWEALAQCFEITGEKQELRNCYRRLGALYQSMQDFDVALGYLQRAESLLPGRYIPILKQQLSIYFTCQRLEEAYVAARNIIEAYVATGEREAALNFLRLLPSFGPPNIKWRRELAQLIPGKEGKTESLLRSTWRSLPRYSGERSANPTASSVALNSSMVTATPPGELVVIEPTQDLGIDLSTLFTPAAPVEQPAATPATAPTETPTAAPAEAPASETATAEAQMQINIAAPAVNMAGYTLLLFANSESVRADVAAAVAQLGCQAVEVNTAEMAAGHLSGWLPSLVLAEMGSLEWYRLFAWMQACGEIYDLPFICLSRAEGSEELVQALNSGTSGCWHWPMVTDELAARIRHALLSSYDERNAVMGQLSEISLPDAMQMIEGCRKTGMLALKRGMERGELYFSDGRPVDAQFSRWIGEAAFFRLISWTDGLFRFHSQPITRTENIHETVQGLLMEAMRRIDEQAKIVESLPDPETVLIFNPGPTVPISPALQRVRDLFDGQRKLSECLFELDMDIEALELVALFYQREILTKR